MNRQIDLETVYDNATALIFVVRDAAHDMHRIEHVRDALEALVDYVAAVAPMLGDADRADLIELLGTVEARCLELAAGASVEAA